MLISKTGSSLARLARYYVVLLALLASAVHAQHMMHGPELEFSTSGESFVAPEDVASGFATVSLANDEPHLFTLLLVRPVEGVPAEDVVEAVRRIDAAFMGAGNPVEALNEALELATVIGEAQAYPGSSSRFGVTLEPGRYIAIGTAQREEEGPLTTYREVTVGSGSTVGAPEADHVIRMVDFAFALPAGIRAGEQTWEVMNVGEQLHHLVLSKVHPGRTLEEALAFMQTFEGEPPLENVAYVGILSSGESNFVTLDLAPGTYIALCFMPDHLGDATGAPHVALGMMQSFVIEGN